MPAHPSATDRIALPAPPQEPARREFPLLATAAPVIGSLVMWAVTGSPFALVFAFLGPVIAVGSLIDARRHGKRSARAETRRFNSDVDAVLTRIESAHDRERRELLGQALHPHELLANPARDPEWWRQSWRGAIPVCLGIGVVPSILEVETPAAGVRPEIAEAHARVVAAASSLASAPVFVDARDGIGIVGPSTTSAALARAIVAQLGFRLSPADTMVTADAAGRLGWALRLPHPSTPHPSTPHPSIPARTPDRVEFHPSDHQAAAQVVCVVAADASLVPRECRVLIRLDGAGNAAVERNPSGATIDRFRPWFVSDVQAEQLVEVAAACAAADGLAQHADPLPDQVEFADLVQVQPPTGGLPACFSVTASGAVVVDLVRDGPHAVLGGTTGSGKSELLVSWVLALATACSPAEVNFLLVDFKGGSSFAAVSRLPHTVGLITDLDQASARRALDSLQAELRHRERVLAAEGARSLDELPDDQRMPRLVILVDEFAVVVNEFPELQALFADLAGRGRSLGIHLVLCTQRPAGVIRDSVLANCSLRLSLRVNNAADSTAVIGTPAAAELAAGARGRCLLSVGGATPTPMQVALAAPGDAERIIARYREHPYSVRRPWLDPLPPVISLAEVRSRTNEDGVAFGLADVPETQSQPAAVYQPRRDGNLLVLGGMGSGKTEVLAALQSASALQGRQTRLIPSSVEGAWDLVRDAVTGRGTPRAEPMLLLLDDLDALLPRFSPEHQLEFGESLARLLREGSSQGHRMVLTAARLTSSIQSLVAMCDSRLILRMANRQEHLLAGGEGADFSAELAAGAGTWRGHPVQVALAAPADAPQPSAPVSESSCPGRAPWPLGAATGFALVAAGAGAMAERIRQHQGAPSALDVVELATQPAGGGTVQVLSGSQAQVLVGDAAAWQANWGLFAAARGSGPVAFAGCSTQEFRTLTGIRQLPPPIGPEPGGGWLLTGNGSVTRVQLPEWSPRASVEITIQAIPHP